MSTQMPPVWRGLVDDAAVFPPGNSPLAEAVATHRARRSEWYADLVGALVLTDVAVPELDGPDRPRLSLAVVVTGGAGAIAGALRLGARSPHEVVALETALRDPDDLPGNARRVVAAVDAARDQGLLDDTVAVHVELPQQEPGAGWLAAADVVAEAELRLKFRTGGVEADLHPPAGLLAAWVDAALDRETPFKCTAGLHHAVRCTSAEGFEQHGFLNVLLATRTAFDGAGADEVVGVLETRDADVLLERWRDHGDDAMARTRRWFTSYGSCSVSDPLDDLLALGLLEEPS